MELAGTLGLWATVVALGVYHGLNPAMGWPLAVANGLSERRDRAVVATLLPLGAGHLLAMALVLLPFALLAQLVEWNVALRTAAGLLVIGFGIWRLVDRRHPRSLARVPPTRLAWWSFLMATAHGAALMLVPITLGLCASSPGQRTAMAVLLGGSVATATAVALVHTLAMVLSGVAIAWLVYRWLGLRFLRQGWFNLDALWAASLILTGAAGLLTTLR